MAEFYRDNVSNSFRASTPQFIRDSIRNRFEALHSFLFPFPFHTFNGLESMRGGEGGVRIPIHSGDQDHDIPSNDEIIENSWDSVDSAVKIEEVEEEIDELEEGQFRDAIHLSLEDEEYIREKSDSHASIRVKYEGSMKIEEEKLSPSDVEELEEIELAKRLSLEQFQKHSISLQSCEVFEEEKQMKDDIDERFSEQIANKRPNLGYIVDEEISVSKDYLREIADGEEAELEE